MGKRTIANWLVVLATAAAVLQACDTQCAEGTMNVEGRCIDAKASCPHTCRPDWTPQCLADCNIVPPATCPSSCHRSKAWDSATCAEPCRFPDAGLGAAGMGSDAGQADQKDGDADGERGDAGGMFDCEPACNGSTAHCDTMTGQCVACLDSKDCEEGLCDRKSHECVACLEDTDCTGSEAPRCFQNSCVECEVDEHCSGDTPACDPETRNCEPCVEDGDCPAPARSHCDRGLNECVPCQSHSHCEGVADGDTSLSRCSDGECVECTASDATACGTDGAGRAYVCNPLEGRCSEQTQGSQALCAECTSDAACKAGMRCVREILDGQQLGYVCLWERGAPHGDAPADCMGAGRPYAFRRDDVRSIDGATVSVCGLTATTCEAIQDDFDATSCAHINDDAACGIKERDDGLCAVVDPDADPQRHRCTIPCETSEDCPHGHACNTLVAASYCDLNRDACYADADCPEEHVCGDANRCQSVWQ